MSEATPRQRQILEFIAEAGAANAVAPTVREIARHFRLRSSNTVAQHLAALRKKGLLEGRPRQARSLRVVSPLGDLRRTIAHIPIYGAIPAGRPQDRTQEADGCLSIDVASLGIRPTPRTLALKVCGDSMNGKAILDGDMVVVEHGAMPRNGDIVAALIDGASTLKTFVQEKGAVYLRAENPRYPKLIPAAELVIQGVVVAVIRKLK